MVNDLSQTKKEIKSFLLINFGIIATFAILLFISSYNLKDSLTPMNFASVFMSIPSFAAILTLKKASKISFNKEVDFFFKIFTISTLIEILVICIGTFISPSITSNILGLVQGIASICLVLDVLIYGDSFESLNLRFTKNIKKVFLFILIFMVLQFLSGILEYFITSEAFTGTLNFGRLIRGIISNFLFGFILFFGEEFGWRYFLQPRMQAVYGKRFGVIILGAIWGIWHAPLCFTLYSPETPIHCTINYIISCIPSAIFYAYVYMKTENLWTPILIHLIGNCSIFLFMSHFDFVTNYSICTIKDIISSTIISVITFCPFLLTKTFKKDSKDI